MFSFINIDAIVSDPWLLTASVLLVAGPLLFLFSLIKFFLTPKPAPTPFPFERESPISRPDTVVSSGAARESNGAGTEPAVNAPAIESRRAPAPALDMEKTMVLPAGVADIQAQLGIALTQIKTINKKIHEMESEITKISRLAQVKLENSEWKEPPANAADFAQKLLKLAEHVIVLEKDVARIKGGASAPESSPSSTADVSSKLSSTSAQTPPLPRPPIMPL